MNLNDLYMTQADVILLFVMGFTFFIACFDKLMASYYLMSILIGSLWAMFMHYKADKKKEKKK